jgi:hypothetical protein
VRDHFRSERGIEAIKELTRLLTHPWLLSLGAIVLVAGHVFFFKRLWHAGMSLPVLSGLVLLLIAKHLGAFGPLYSFFRRRSRH